MEQGRFCPFDLKGHEKNNNNWSIIVEEHSAPLSNHLLRTYYVPVIFPGNGDIKMNKIWTLSLKNEILKEIGLK